MPLLPVPTALPQSGLLARIGDIIDARHRFMGLLHSPDVLQQQQMQQQVAPTPIGGGKMLSPGEALAREGMAWSRTSAGRGRDPTHNKSILSQYQQLPAKEQIAFSQYVKDATYQAMDKPNDWTSAPAPMSRAEAIQSQRENARPDSLSSLMRPGMPGYNPTTDLPSNLPPGVSAKTFQDWAASSFGRDYRRGIEEQRAAQVSPLWSMLARMRGLVP